MNQKLTPIEEVLVKALSRTQISPVESLQKLVAIGVWEISQTRAFSPKMSLSLANLWADPDSRDKNDLKRLFQLSELSLDEKELFFCYILVKVFFLQLPIKELIRFLDSIINSQNIPQLENILKTNESIIANFLTLDRFSEVAKKQGIQLSKQQSDLVQAEMEQIKTTWRAFVTEIANTLEQQKIEDSLKRVATDFKNILMSKL